MHGLVEAVTQLRGEGTVLTPGLWAFIDGNHLGGVGVVAVGCLTSLKGAGSSPPQAQRSLCSTRSRMSPRFRNFLGPKMGVRPAKATQ